MPKLFLSARVFGVAPAQCAPVMVHQIPLAAADGYVVHYTGRLLTQTHGDVLMALMSLLGGVEQGNEITVRICDLERILCRSSGKRNRDCLWDQIMDLGAACLRVQHEGVESVGSLMPFGRWDGQTVTLEVNRELIELAHGGFTLIDRDARRQLVRKPLAQWLQLYTAWLESDGRRAVELDEVHDASRSEMGRRQLRFRAKAALYELASVGAPAWRLHGDDWLRAV
jgi:hypothetical protein